MRRGDGGSDWLRLRRARRASSASDRARRGAAGVTRLALAEWRCEPLAFGANDNAFVAAIAAEEPRGLYPRGFVGEQNYWTLVATPEGGDSGLIDEGGAIEVGRGGFSVEPFVDDSGRLTSWADVTLVTVAAPRALPIPTVVLARRGWSLAIDRFCRERSALVGALPVAQRGTGAAT